MNACCGARTIVFGNSHAVETMTNVMVLDSLYDLNRILVQISRLLRYTPYNPYCRNPSFRLISMLCSILHCLASNLAPKLNPQHHLSLFLPDLFLNISFQDYVTPPPLSEMNPGCRLTCPKTARSPRSGVQGEQSGRVVSTFELVDARF